MKTGETIPGLQGGKGEVGSWVLDKMRDLTGTWMKGKGEGGRQDKMVPPLPRST